MSPFSPQGKIGPNKTTLHSEIPKEMEIAKQRGVERKKLE